MENSSPPRHHRLVWLALATFGTLLLLPGTRYLLRSQMQMQALNYTTQTKLDAQRAAAARLPEDYPVQLAIATQLPTSVLVADASSVDRADDSLARTKARNRNIAALAERFPNNPSVYANLLRYMTLGEVRTLRDPKPYGATTAANVTIYMPSQDSLDLFIGAAQKGAELDPDNAYFPMMQAIGLLDAYRDHDAMEALKTAGRCSQWKEYFQDEHEGDIRLMNATYGEQGAVQNLSWAASLLFPQYSSLRSAARTAIRLVAAEELAGNIEEGIEVRHAVMRCGGLMRAQGTSQITAFVGIAITNLGIYNPGGASEADNQALISGPPQGKDAEELRAERVGRYDDYLLTLNRGQEAVWANAEINAGEQAKAIGMEATERSIYSGQSFYQLGLCWLADNALLSGVVILLILGGTAALAGRLRPRKGLMLWRLIFVLLIVGGIGLWQWQASHVGMMPYIDMQNLFSGTANTSNDYNDSGNAFAVQALAAGLSLLIPVLLVGLIAAVSLFQRVPLSTGLGRGLRGVAIPAAALLFLVYGASLLPTAYMESVVNTEITRTVQNEPHRNAELVGKAWPGDPQP